jgi:hypothetical protein
MMKIKVLLSAMFLPILLTFTSITTYGNITLTQATGGTNICSVKAADGITPTWTTLGNFKITEGATGDFSRNSSGTIVFTMPTGWSFNTTPTPTITATSADFLTLSISAITSTALTINWSTSNANPQTILDIITISGVQIRANNTTSAAGNITCTSISQAVSGLSTGNVFASLSLAKTAAPTGTTPQVFCSSASPTVANLSATGTSISWYASASATTSLATSTALINSTHYYATQTLASCESNSRLDVTASLITSPSITSNPSDKSIASGNNTSFSVTASNSPTSYTWEVSSDGGTNWSTLSNGGVYTNTTTATLNITGAPIGMNGYKYRAKATNACGTSSVSTLATLTVAYCTHTNSTNTTYYISNFSTTSGVTNITNNTSGFSANGYGNFTAQTVTQLRGSSVNFSITSGNGTMNYGIWVDWNNDGDFVDAGEQVHLTNTMVNTTSGTITVPAGATLGNLRMRVTCEYMSGSAVYCTGGAYTECEDYTFVVTDGTPCAGTPTGGTATASTASFSCSGSTNITLSGQSTGFSGITLQWQQSADGSMGWANVSTGAGGTSATYTTPTLTATTYYRCVVTCANGGGTSNSSVAAVTINANVPGTAVANINPVCNGTTTTLSISGGTVSNSTYQWQSSVDGSSWTNISAATSATYVATITSTTYFRRKVICTSSGDTSSSTCINVILIPNCYLISNSATDTTCSGAFFDNGGAGGTYSNDANYTKTICSTAGSLPIMTFTVFSTENSFDSLRIYDGNSTAAPLIGRYMGTTSPGTIIGSNTCLTYQFKSDGFVSYSGWEATLSCTTPCSGTPAGGTATATLTNGCVGYSTLLNVTGASGYSGLTYQWQYSTDNSTWNNLVGGTNATQDTTVSGTYYYRRLSTCTSSGLSASSASVQCTSYSCEVPPCLSNPAAGDSPNTATPICNLNGYCGNTSSDYTIDAPGNVGALFCGIIDNNSWLSFVANDDMATLNIFVSNCVDGKGIQMEIYSTSDFITFTSHSNCWSPANQVNGTITATGLTVGETYYLMIDGWSGDVCDYVIAAATGSGVLLADAGPDIIIQSGENTQLTATGGTTYVWAPPSGLSNPNIADPIAAPSATTTYTVSVTGGNPVCPSTAVSQVTVTVESTLPVELLYFKGECLNEQYMTLKWATASETNNDYFTIEGSSDALIYHPLGIIKGNGNSNEINQYSTTFKDRENIYYRLRQTDYDGVSALSNSINVDCGEKSIRIYPNPTKQGEEIIIDGEYSFISIRNIYGTEIKTMTEGDRILDLPQGVYTVEIDHSYKIKLIVI